MPADHTMPEEFWRGRRVLLTGHTGFKGAWLSLWLRGWGARVTGYALAPSSTPNLWSIVEGDTTSIIGDVRDFAQLRAAVRQADPQIVIHMAAQALVRESYRDPLGTYATNVLGTGTLLLACRELDELGVRGGRHERQGLRERWRRPAVRRGRSTRRPRSVQQQQGVHRAADGQLPRQLLRRRSAHRLGSCRQRHRRRRLVHGPSDSRLRQGARDRQAGDTALSGCRPTVAARARAALGLPRARAEHWCRRRTTRRTLSISDRIRHPFARCTRWSMRSARASQASLVGNATSRFIRRRRTP